ncbi:25089_t:CDS:1, partial [Dentiscutata erythropus]
ASLFHNTREGVNYNCLASSDKVTRRWDPTQNYLLFVDIPPIHYTS